jgi:hypothetical protein
MSQPVFPLLDTDQIKAEIKLIVGQDKLDQLQANHAGYLEDFCGLGVLMTDAETCYKALTVLNSLLVNRLSKTTIPLKKSKLEKTEEGEVKHFGLLSNFFKAWEATWGFNAAQNLPMVPQNPKVPAHTVPTLTGFVSIDKFRTHLFAPGYHWKDPGVGVNHGEFTHRIQWYIATQVNVWNPFLRKTPLEIFKMFANDLCRGVGENVDKTVWDVVFDRLLAKTDFRTPEVLHAWFKQPGQQKDKNVGVLAQLIAGRSLKREHQNFNLNKLNQKQADEQIDIKAKDAQSDIVWYTTRDFHPKSLENPKVLWEKSDLVL